MTRTNLISALAALAVLTTSLPAWAVFPKVEIHGTATDGPTPTDIEKPSRQK